MQLPEETGVSRAALLGLARRSIDYGFEHRAPLPVRLEEMPAAFAEPAATFTTLRLEGELRGCCGQLEAAEPLARDVAHSAFTAAFRDPRFEPLGRDEFAAITLEVSILTPMESMQVADEADLLEQLQPGIDGLVIAEGWRRATFLPKVWENLPEPRHFLGQLKLKCGLPRDYWSSQLEFRRYRTTTFTEPTRASASGR
jgi:AmmeMemoRadiSam system protein A